MALAVRRMTTTRFGVSHHQAHRDLRKCQEELKTTRAVLGDLLEERGIKPLWAVSIHNDEQDPDELVIRAGHPDEVKHYVKEHLFDIFGSQVGGQVLVFPCRAWRLGEAREGVLDVSFEFEFNVQLD